MKMNYDMHIHTEFCGHAPGMSVEALCSRADEIGLETIAITDHVFSEEGLCVLTAIRAELSRLKTRCRVILGAEVDVDGRYDDGRLVTESLEAIDYVIAGFHYIPTIGNYPLTPDDCVMKPDRFIEVWRSTLLGVVSNRAVDTLAHPGRLVASAVDMDAHFEHILAIFEEAAVLSAENKIAWEINELTGTRLNGTFQREWYRISQIALEAGVKLIYGSDAHSPASIGQTVFTEMILGKLGSDCLSMPEEILKAKLL